MRRAAAVVLAALLAGAGCARDQPQPVAGTTLEATEWQLASGVVAEEGR